MNIGEQIDSIVGDDAHGRTRRLKDLNREIGRLSTELGELVDERDRTLEAAGASDSADHEHKRLRQCVTRAKRSLVAAATNFNEKIREYGATNILDPRLSPVQKHELDHLFSEHSRTARVHRTAVENLSSFEVSLSMKRAAETLLDVDDPKSPTLQAELDRLDERVQYLRQFGGQEVKVKKLSIERKLVIDRYNDIQTIELEKMRRPKKGKNDNGKART